MRKRPMRVVVYFSPKEYRQYLMQLNTSGLSKQAHGLKALLGKEIKPRKCEHHPQLLESLSSLSNDTHLLLHALQGNGQLTEAEIALLQSRIDGCWQLLRSY